MKGLNVLQKLLIDSGKATSRYVNRFAHKKRWSIYQHNLADKRELMILLFQESEYKELSGTPPASSSDVSAFQINNV